MSRKSEPSQRQLRVGELIRHALAEIFARDETGNEIIEKAAITVLEVSMSPDLRQGLAYVRPLLDGDEEMVLKTLKQNSKYIRKLIAPRLGLKYLPKIAFELDTAIDNARRIEDILHDPKVARDLSSPES